MVNPIIQDRTEFNYPELHITHERLFNPGDKSLFAALLTSLLEICLRFQNCDDFIVYKTITERLQSQRIKVTTAKPNCREVFDYSFKAFDYILYSRNVELSIRYGYIIKYMRDEDVIPSVLITLHYLIQERLTQDTIRRFHNYSYEIPNLLEIVEATAIVFDVNIIVLLESAEIIKFNEENNKAKMFLYVRNSGITSILYTDEMIQLESFPQYIEKYGEKLVSHKVPAYPQFSQKVPGNGYSTASQLPINKIPPAISSSNVPPPILPSFQTVEHAILNNTVFSHSDSNTSAVIQTTPGNSTVPLIPSHPAEKNINQINRTPPGYPPGYSGPPGTSPPILGNNLGPSQPSGYSSINPSPGSYQSYPREPPQPAGVYSSEVPSNPGHNKFQSPAVYPVLNQTPSFNNSASSAGQNNPLGSYGAFIPNVPPPVKPEGYVTTSMPDYDVKTLPPPPSAEERLKSQQPPPSPLNVPGPMMAVNPMNQLNLNPLPGLSGPPALSGTPPLSNFQNNPINPPGYHFQAPPPVVPSVPQDVVDYLLEIGNYLHSFNVYDENLRLSTNRICEKYPEIGTQFRDKVLSIPSLAKPPSVPPVAPPARPDTVRLAGPNFLPPGHLPGNPPNRQNAPGFQQAGNKVNNDRIMPGHNIFRQKMCLSHKNNEMEDNFSDISCPDCKNEVCTRCRIQDTHTCVSCLREYSARETETLEILKMTLGDTAPPAGFIRSQNIVVQGYPQPLGPPYQDIQNPGRNLGFPQPLGPPYQDIQNPGRNFGFQGNLGNNHMGHENRDQQNKLCDVHGAGVNKDYFTNEVKCPDNCQVCNHCRFQNMENCPKCDRAYSNSEKEMLEVLKMTSIN